MEQLKLDLIIKSEEETAKSILSTLLNQSRLYYCSKDYKELLDFVTKLRNFAPFNAFLLNLQKPGLRFAASQHDWEQQFRRKIKEGARPLLILWPFGPVAIVYDVEDTEGVPLPDSVKNAFRAKGKLNEKDIDKFIALLGKKGIEIKRIEYGDAHAGHIRLGIVKKSTDAKTLPLYHIRINSKHDPNVQFVTLIHELAHLFLGHLGDDKYLKITDRRRLIDKEVELEAESLAYIVCKRNGVESKSETYLSDYVKKNTNIENIDLYQLLKAAGQIETILKLGGKVSFGPHKK